MDRRNFIKKGIEALGVMTVASIGGIALTRSVNGETVWQIDPEKCSLCGKCATLCVLNPSAVKCVIDYKLCEGKKDNPAYFKRGVKEFVDNPENRVCPSGALKRKKINDNYYEYSVDESLCIGCGKCGLQSRKKGTGAMYLQIKHNKCVHCNECAIDVGCPEHAIKRISSKQAYLLKK